MVTAIARSCFAALKTDSKCYGRALPRHALLTVTLIRALVVSKIDCNYRRHVQSEQLHLSWLFQSVLNALLKRSFRRGNRITYPRCSMSSTGCGSWIGSGSGCAFWWTAAFTARRRHLADSLRRTADVDGCRSPSTLFRLGHVGRGPWHRRTVQHSATVHSQWLHQERGMACLLSQSQPLRLCRRFVRN